MTLTTLESESKHDPAGAGAFAIDRRLPAAEQVYRKLRSEIITCRLAPYETISENRICGMFGVSRSPVRVAVTRLAEDGLVEIFPQRGTFVAPIKMKQVREAHFARSALEVALSREAARHWKESHSVEIRKNLERQNLHAKHGDSQKFFLDNESFHLLIAQAARLEGVWATVQSVKTIWDRIGHIANQVPAHTLEIIAEHEAIVRAMESHDPNEAETAMLAHMDSVNHAIARLQPLHASYFVEEQTVQDFARWATSDGTLYAFKYVNGHSKNMKQGLQTVTAYAWNEFLFGLMLTTTEATLISVGASIFFAAPGGGVRWGVAAAVMMFATLPPLLLGLFMYRQIGKSMTAGAVKG